MSTQRDLFGEETGVDHRDLKPAKPGKGKPFDVLFRAIDHRFPGEPPEILRRSDALHLVTGQPGGDPLTCYEDALGLWTNLAPGGTRYEAIPMPKPEEAVVYCDPLFTWPFTAKTAQAQRHFGDGKQSCHLYVAGPILALHLFAHRLGMRTPLTHAKHWLHALPDHPHYDLTPTKRALAVKLGAREVSLQEARDARRMAKGIAALLLFATGAQHEKARRMAPTIDDAWRCETCARSTRFHLPDPFDGKVRVLCSGERVRIL